MEKQFDDDATLKKRLLARTAVAVVVLAALLGSLAVFDSMNAPPPVPDKGAAMAVTPRPAPNAVESVAKEAALPPPAEAAKDAPAEAKPEAAVAEDSALPKSIPPLPTYGDKPLTRPASGRHALMQKPEPVAPAAKRPDPIRELTGPRAEQNVAIGPPPVEAPAASRSVLMTAARPFALQLGVFSDVANAEELRARLEKSGVRATIEARVHVGPFATRAEADAAKQKLRELGVADALVLSMKARKAP